MHREGDQIACPEYDSLAEFTKRPERSATAFARTVCRENAEENPNDHASAKVPENAGCHVNLSVQIKDDPRTLALYCWGCLRYHFRKLLRV